MRECPADQRLFIGGDLNGHIGATADGYAGVHGGFGYGGRNDEGCSILEFATAHNLVVANSFFQKRDVLLITFQSGGHSTRLIICWCAEMTLGHVRTAGFSRRDMRIPTQIGCLGYSFPEESTQERGDRDAKDFVENS